VCVDTNRVEQFAQLYAKKVGVNVSVLQQTLWGDYYLDSKTKTVKKGAQVSWIHLPVITLPFPFIRCNSADFVCVTKVTQQKIKTGTAFVINDNFLNGKMKRTIT